MRMAGFSWISAIGTLKNPYHTCACWKLYPAVLMMKSAEDWPYGKLALPVDWPMGRRIFSQGQVRSEFVVIAGVGGKDSTQMGLAEDADQSLRMSVLPR
jgi:hypothetical protein